MKIELGNGETTCARAPGKFCRMLLATHFGTSPVCGLYRDKAGDSILLKEGPDGWLRRCKQCLEEERANRQ